MTKSILTSKPIKIGKDFRIEFISDCGKVVNVFLLGPTKNKKISQPGEIILQSYHFDIKQIEFRQNDGKGINLETGFIQPSLTKNNCLSCPLRVGGCYTFKYEQALGHLSMITSIGKKYKNISQIPTLNNDIIDIILRMLDKTNNKYIRFGSYGCPTNLPLFLVELLAKKANNYTGYSHDWKNPAKFEYFKYFMSSTHKNLPLFSSQLANDMGFRTFETDSDNGILCPNVSKGVSCSKCGLCSGTQGKGKTNIFLPSH